MTTKKAKQVIQGLTGNCNFSNHLGYLCTVISNKPTCNL